MEDDFYTTMPKELVAALDVRGARKPVTERDLARYYGLLKQGVKSIDGVFTPDELCFMIDISRVSVLDANYIDLLPFLVNDALIDTGRKVDGPSLMNKVWLLDVTARYALADSIERVWTRKYRDEETSSRPCRPPERETLED